MHFNCPEQLAGFSRLDFYLLTETSNWPFVVNDANAGTILITPQATIDVDGSIEPETIKVTDDVKPDGSGDIWPIDIQFIYLYRGAAMEQLLENYANKPGIAIGHFNDGTCKLFGTDKEPLYLSWGNNYGVKPEDRHGVGILIKGEQTQRPVYYSPE